jgi:hypothetical protein
MPLGAFCASRTASPTAKNCSPALVTETLLVMRKSNCAPSWVSSHVTCFVTVPLAMPSRFAALMTEVDLPIGGKRERDNRNDFSIPFKFTTKNVFDFAKHPGWVFDVLRNGMPVMENLISLDATAFCTKQMPRESRRWAAML